MSSDALLPVSQNSIGEINLSGSNIAKCKNKREPTEIKRGTIPLNHAFSSKPRFKRNLNCLIRFFDNHATFFNLCKLLFGLLLLASPIIMVGVYPYYSSLIYVKYYMLPFISCAGISCALLILLLLYRVGDDIRTRGMLIASWERRNILKIIHCIIINILIIWILKSFENLITNFSYLKEYVSQNKNKIEEYKEVSLGMYWIDVFFCAFFWDKQYTTLPYFDITKNFIELLNANITKIYSSVTTISFIYLVKLIFCKTKNEICYFIITLCSLYECVLYYVYYWSSYKAYQSTNSTLYKIIELGPLLVVLICSLILCIKRYPIGLFKRKFGTYISHKLNLFCLIVVILSFIIALGGIGLLGWSILYLIFYINIEPTLTIERMNMFKSILWLGVILFIVGNAFYFGTYSFNLIFKPIAYEGFPAVLKNPYYLKANVKKSKRCMSHSHKKKKILI